MIYYALVFCVVTSLPPVVAWLVVRWRMSRCLARGHQWVAEATGHRCRACGHQLHVGDAL